MSIKFTQYLRPDGRQITVSIDLPDEVEGKAIEILDAGYGFAVEVTEDGMVIAYIVDDINELDLATTVVHNGPRVPEAIATMIMDYQLSPIQLA